MYMFMFMCKQACASALHPSSMLVYLRDRSAQTSLCAATLRQKLQIRSSTSPSHNILTLGQSVPSLTLQHQAPCRVATGLSSFSSLAWLDPEKSPQHIWEYNPRTSTLKADALTTMPTMPSKFGRKWWRHADTQGIFKLLIKGPICQLSALNGQISTSAVQINDVENLHVFLLWTALEHSFFVGWLLNVPATCKCISGTDLLRQYYVLSHWDRSCRPNFLRLTQSQYTDTWLISPSTDPIPPGAWQGSHWSANF